jgi:hypothetical protein
MAITEDGGFGLAADNGSTASMLIVGPDRAAITRAARRIADRVGCEGPQQLVRGVRLWVYTQRSPLTPATSARYRTVAVAELERAGVTDASLAIPDATDEQSAPEALFAERPITLPAEDLARLLGVLGDALVLCGRSAPALRELDPRAGVTDHPLGYLSELPALPVRSLRPLELERCVPLWIVDERELLAHVPEAGGSIYVRADLRDQVTS